jgi:hypothetical protein
VPLRPAGITIPRMRQRQFVHRPGHEPPANEIPAVLATADLASRADHIALAIPSLLVYSTGFELLLCRYREGRTVDRSEDRQEAANRYLESFRESVDQLPQRITVNANPVEMLGGQGDSYGFTYQAWARFRPEAAGAALVFSLSWPGVPTTTSTIDAAQIADAVGRVISLWPAK